MTSLIAGISKTYDNYRQQFIKGIKIIGPFKQAIVSRDLSRNKLGDFHRDRSAICR